MSKITVDLVKLIEQAMPQICGSVEHLLLQQWLGYNIGAEQPVTIDLATVPVKDEAGTPSLPPPHLQSQMSDIAIFSDTSELRIYILAPGEDAESLATDAYHELLAAIANLQIERYEADRLNISRKTH
jgi:hypothetical protein